MIVGRLWTDVINDLLQQNLMILEINDKPITKFLLSTGQYDIALVPLTQMNSLVGVQMEALFLYLPGKHVYEPFVLDACRPKWTLLITRFDT